MQINDLYNDFEQKLSNIVLALPENSFFKYEQKGKYNESNTKTLKSFHSKISDFIPLITEEFRKLKSGELSFGKVENKLQSIDYQILNPYSVKNGFLRNLSEYADKNLESIIVNELRIYSQTNIPQNITVFDNMELFPTGMIYVEKQKKDNKIKELKQVKNLGFFFFTNFALRYGKKILEQDGILYLPNEYFNAVGENNPGFVNDVNQTLSENIEQLVLSEKEKLNQEIKIGSAARKELREKIKESFKYEQ